MFSPVDYLSFRSSGVILMRLYWLAVEGEGFELGILPEPRGFCPNPAFTRLMRLAPQGCVMNGSR